MKADVIGIRGQRSLIRTEDGRLMECLSSRQQPRCCCGDVIMVDVLNDAQCRLVDIFPRKTLFGRSDPFKTKLMAANISQVVIVAAVFPTFSDELISRVLTAANLADIRCLVVLNKVDLTEGYDLARKSLQPFVDIGVSLIETSQDSSVDALKARLDNEFSLLMGQSGMGKSTLLNRLIPGANALTREISSALNSGKHTTTASTLYDMAGHPRLVDSPGLQQFGLFGQTKSAIEANFPDFVPYLGHCRFDDCNHLKEPGCAITEAISHGKIDDRRLAVFHKIIAENAFKPY